MKIAVAQMSCALGDLKTNLRQIRDFSTSARARGADLIVFPEMADTGYSMSVASERATSLDEGAVPALRRCAQTLALPIVCGISERDGDRIYNTQVFVDRTGEIAAKYRKSHLFSVPPGEETKCFTPGDEFVAVDHGGFRFGFSICYDLRFPEVYRALAVEKQANVFVISSAWPLPRMQHFRTLALTRAIENQSYVIVSNRVGTDEGVTFCGSSAIIDPYGVVLADASADREELIQADISNDVIQSVRSRMSVFDDRRRDLY